MSDALKGKFGEDEVDKVANPVPSVHADQNSVLDLVKPPYSKLTHQLKWICEESRQNESQWMKKLELRRFLYEILSPYYYADICLVFTDRPARMDQATEAFLLLSKVQTLISGQQRFYDIELIAAKIPLLKFKDRIANIRVDLNAHNTVGIRNTRLLKAYCDCDPRLTFLVLVIKRWAKYNDINSAHRKTLSSYSLTLMAIHFLQITNPPVLPCLQTSIPEKFGKKDDYNRYSLTEMLMPWTSKNTQSLGELFVHFLKYFSEFDFAKSAISVRLGRILSKSVVRSYRNPKNTPTQWNFVCIEEPFDRSNVACAVHDVAIFERILYVFQTSYRCIQNNYDYGLICPLVDPTFPIPPFSAPVDTQFHYRN